MPDPLLLTFVLFRVAGGLWLLLLGIAHNRLVIGAMGVAVLVHAVPGSLAAFDHEPTPFLTALSSGAAIAFVALAVAATLLSRTQIAVLQTENRRLSDALAEIGAPPTDRTSS